ncbi:bifunctional diaminohydroxyphosphoribosylaminopyrimidine deaminase/5-amino-6-(5-phosphoribosylamino)uracil reductase RibD [Candidatus Peregrinibacteria bacterium]|nr:bifunctional diaminohydroxyphosphoribosylaminopyrimidine deaminase/5-amino-6-(5-phosphoribosylamino)uracil reductase RibD [Candidatus Peregrinibacteria bacterium]
MKNKFFEIAFMHSLKGIPMVAPNPPVGAVLVKDGKAICASHHKAYGKAHAEVNVIQEFKKKFPGISLSDLDMYVTLEPCCTQGKTEPCTDLILNSGINNIYIAHKDANNVNSRGAKVLMQNGLNVKFLEKNTDIFKKINLSLQPFIKWHLHKLPYVTLKAGITLDGKLATADKKSKWITQEDARLNSSKIRNLHDAVLIGKTTFIEDNPSLKFKNINSQQKQIVLCDDLNFSDDLKLLKSKRLVFFVGNKASGKRVLKLSNLGHEVYVSKSELFSAEALFKALYDLKIQSIFVEGGARVHGFFYDSFLQNSLFVDRLLIYYAPFLMGNNESVSIAQGTGVSDLSTVKKLKEYTLKAFSRDFCLDGYFNLYPDK